MLEVAPDAASAIGAKLAPGAASATGAKLGTLAPGATGAVCWTAGGDPGEVLALFILRSSERFLWDLVDPGFRGESSLRLFTEPLPLE